MRDLERDEDGWPQMEWFGVSWGGPVCEPEFHGETPVGSICPECNAHICDGHQGFRIPYLSFDGPPWLAYHRRCFQRTVLGMLDPDVTTDS